jgi:hypothetical protein
MFFSTFVLSLFEQWLDPLQYTRSITGAMESSHRLYFAFGRHFFAFVIGMLVCEELPMRPYWLSQVLQTSNRPVLRSFRCFLCDRVQSQFSIGLVLFEQMVHEEDADPSASAEAGAHWSVSPPAIACRIWSEAFPMISLTTPPNFRFVSSWVFCTRLNSAPSLPSATRYSASGHATLVVGQRE